MAFSLWRTLRVFLLQVVLISAVTLLLLEAIVAFSFRYPAAALLPPALLRYLHVQFDRRTIQVMPECAVYDPEVTYTLRPGECIFSNREYSNRYSVNSAGLRDDEASLRQPEVIMLGDSLTMGWGVEQHEAYPAQVERSTGHRVLNAGISSYGTVRALKLLERLDRSNLRVLVIQYTDNDYIENEQFVRSGSLHILSREDYQRTVATHSRATAYVPGKYAFNVLVQWQSLLRKAMMGGGAAVSGPDAMEQARVFLRVLEASRVRLEQWRLIVTALDTPFVEAVRDLAARSPQEWVHGIQLVDLGHLAKTAGAFYRLDDHPTADGQARIARDIAAAITPHTRTGTQ